jgi:tetratricopeptide (TPR) repeat protein
MPPVLGPDTDRRVVALVLEGGLASPESVARLASERDRSLARGEKVRSLAHLLCDAGVLDRATASALVARVRAERTAERTWRSRATSRMTLGPYELEAEVGRGGMGCVYRARHTPTGATRAVKLLAGQLEPVAVARFRRESEALGRLGGEGVVPVHDTGIERGQLYFAMAYLPGGSLRGRLRRDGKLPWREAVSLAREVALVLARCHAQGIIHRDVKPDNVLLDEAGRPWLSDFGCVRDLGASRLTETGTTVGTVAYMSPEQLQGKPVDPRVDVHALAVLVHELISGELPFPGRTAFEVLTRMGKPRSRLAALGAPVELDRVLDRALDRRGGERTASVADFARELGAVLDGKTTRARRPALLLAGLLALVAAGSVAGSLTLRGARGPVTPPVAGAGRIPEIRHERSLLEQGCADAIAGNDTAALAALAVLEPDLAALSTDRDVNARLRPFAPALYRRALAPSTSDARKLHDLEAAVRLDGPPAALSSRVAAFWHEKAKGEEKREGDVAFLTNFLVRWRIPELERRLTYLERAVELDPTVWSNDLWALIGLMHGSALNSPEANDVAIEILRASAPRNPLLLLLEARALAQPDARGVMKDALGAMKKVCEAMAQVPADETRAEPVLLFDAAVDLGYLVEPRCVGEPGDEDLLETLERATIRVKDTHYGYLIAQAWQRRRRFDRALESLDRATPDPDWAYYFCAVRCQVLVAQGKKAEAIAAARELVKTADNRDSRQLLDWCEHSP